MAIPHDNSVLSGLITGDATPTLAGFAVGAGSDRVLYVHVVTHRQTATVTHNSITFGNQSLTKIVAEFTDGTRVDHSVWRLIAPDNETNDIAVTLSGASPCRIFARAYENVDQSTPNRTPATGGGNGATASVDVASVADDLVIDFVGCDGARTLTAGSGQTARGGPSSTDPLSSAGGELVATGTTTTMTWTLPTDQHAIAGLALIESSGPPPVTGTLDVTLDDVSITASGTVVQPVTGTVDVTLDDVSITASGTVVQDTTGAADITLADVTPTASGTVTVPEVVVNDLTTDSYNPDDVQTYQTASIDPTDGGAVWLAITVRSTVNEPGVPTPLSVSGLGATWNQVGAFYHDASGTLAKLFLFRGYAATYTAGVISVNCQRVEAGAIWAVVETVNVDSPDNPIVQQVVDGNAAGGQTSLTLTLPGAVTAGNTVLALISKGNTSGTDFPVPETPYSVDSESTDTTEQETVQFSSTAAPTDNTPSWTWGTGEKMAGIAVELAPGTPPPPSVTGTLDLTLADVTSTAAGTVTQPVTGTVDVTLDDVSITASGTSAESGTVDFSTVAGIRDTSVMVNARLSDAASAVLRVATDAGLTQNVVSSTPEVPDGNGWVSFTLGGLQSDTDYHYGIRVDGSSSDPALRGQFPTIVAEGTPFSFTFSHSCCVLDSADAAFADLINEIRTQQAPLFHAFLGDFDYDNNTSETAMRTSFAGQLADSDWAQFVRSIWFEFIYSDHDFLGNNTGGDENPTTRTQRLLRSNVVRDYFPMRDLGDQVTTDGPNYRHFTVGRVLFVIPDERWAKTAPEATEGTSAVMWGSAQRTWFSNLLSSTDARLLVILHDTPWHNSLASQEAEDDWGGFATERQTIADIIQSAGIKTVHVGGDMHANAVADDSASGFDYTSTTDTVTELVIQAGAMEQSGSLKGGPWRLTRTGATNQVDQGDSHYGLVTITDDGTTITFSWAGREATSSTTSVITIPTDASPIAFSFDTISGTLDVTLADVTSTATGSDVISGTLDVTLADVTSTATGVQSHTGTLDQTLADVTSTAAGVQSHTGALDLTLADVTSTAAGVQSHTGALDVTLADVTSTAAGVQSHTGTLDLTLDEVSIAASGFSGLAGTLDQTLADVTSTAAGVQSHTGALDVTLADVTSTAAGVQSHTGALDVTLAEVSIVASGTVAQPVTGTLDVTLADVTSAAVGGSGTLVAGGLDLTLDDVSVAASGTQSHTGALDLQLGDATSTATGVQSHTGTLDQTLADVTSTAAGVQSHTGVLDQVLEDLAVSAAGGTGQLATVDVTLDDVSLAAQGAVSHQGAVDTTLENLVSTAVGTQSHTGTVDVTLADVDLDGLGGLGQFGVLDQTLDDVSIVASGTVVAPAVSGTLDATLADVVSTTSGTQSHTGALDLQLGDVTSAAQGVAANNVGGLDLALSPALLQGVGTWQPQHITGTLDLTLTALGLTGRAVIPLGRRIETRPAHAADRVEELAPAGSRVESHA